MNPFAPWTTPGRLFRAAAYVALGLPVGVATFTVTIAVVTVSASLLPVFLLGVPAAWLGSFAVRGLGRLERSRAALLSGGSQTRSHRSVARRGGDACGSVSDRQRGGANWPMVWRCCRSGSSPM